MKHFIDIENIREQDIDLGEGKIRYNNISGFKVGDIISITTKIDGSNASITYNETTGELDAFSRKQELTYNNTLNGFYNYAKQLDKTAFKNHKNYIVYGEWMGCSKRQNKITYERVFSWLIYSIWDTNTNLWLNQDKVKEFAKESGLEYIEELYYGPFVSWDHCKSFLHNSKYGNVQEGIVIRNIDELKRNGADDKHCHWIIKIVNTDFAESMVKKQRIKDPTKEKAKNEADELLKQIITQNRVEKCLHKLQEEKELPNNLDVQCLGDVAKKLTKRVFEDIVKEEPEIVAKCGEYAGKACNKLTMEIVRKLV